MAFIREAEPFLTIWRVSDDADDKRTAFGNRIYSVSAIELDKACGAAVGGHLAAYDAEDRTVVHALYVLEGFSAAMYDAYNQAITERAAAAAADSAFDT